jgi:alpha-tubulin suppressor-like RCC1 family protein
MLGFAAGKGFRNVLFTQITEPLELLNQSVRFISGGVGHNVIVTEDNYVYVIGGNSSGKLGLGISPSETISEYKRVEHPAFTPGSPRITDISSGFGSFSFFMSLIVLDFTLILCSDGSAFGVGDNTVCILFLFCNEYIGWSIGISKWFSIIWIH